VCVCPRDRQTDQDYNVATHNTILAASTALTASHLVKQQQILTF